MVIRAHGIFCDDVRTEMDGRFILIGVYPGMIIASKSDPVTTVSNWVEISGLEPGEHHVRLRVEFTADGKSKSFGSSTRRIQIEEPWPVVLTAVGLEIKIEHDGILKLYLGIDDLQEIEASQLAYRVVDDIDDEDTSEAHGDDPSSSVDPD